MAVAARVPEEIAARLVSPQAYAERKQLCADLRWLRANRPVGRVEIEGFDPFWLVSRHEDVLEMSRDNARFVSGARPSVVSPRQAEADMRARTGQPFLVRLLINMDAPDHLKHRRIVQGWFQPARMKALEDEIRLIARDAVTRLKAGGPRCDFVRDVALRYPLRVLMNVIGIPAEDEDFLLRMTQEIFGSADKDLSRDAASHTDPAKMIEMTEAVFSDVRAYFAQLTADRRQRPTDDLASAIAQATIDGHPIPDEAAFALYLIVVTAGHDTTSSSTAGALWGLCEHPDEFRTIRADPSAVNGLVEEAIRWTNPVAHFMRTASRDTVLRDTEVAAGDWLMMSYLSANRDESVFADPESFRVDRDASRQIAFGSGAHACIGQHLARMEMRVLFEELMPAISSVELAGTPARSASMFVGGPKSLPLAFEFC